MNAQRLWSVENTAWGSLALLGFLLPVFFIPFSNVSLETIKLSLIQGLAIVSLLSVFIAALRSGTFGLPKGMIFLGALLVLGFYAVASFVSPVMKVSLFGAGNEIDTFASLFVFFLVFFLGALHFRSSNRIYFLYAGLFFSSVILALVQVLRIVFGPEVFNFSELVGPVSNMLGKWNDLSLYFGLTALLSLVTIQFLDLTKRVRMALYSFLVISLLFVGITNFSLTWILLGAGAFLIFVYVLSFGGMRTSGERPMIPMAPLVVGILAVLFLLPGNLLGGFVTNLFNVNQVEVRPSFGATVELAKVSLKENPVFGAGPNRFANVWNMNKPEGVNQTIFWATDFNFASALIPTFLITTGIVGFLTWIFFLGVFLRDGIRAVFKRRDNPITQYLVVSTFLGALYLWAVAFFYVPNAVMFGLAFLLTGVFVAVLMKEGEISSSDIPFMQDPRAGFVSVLVLVVLIIGGVTGGYFFAQRLFSIGHFTNGIEALSLRNDAIAAEGSFVEAINLYEHDSYYRALTQSRVGLLNQVLAQEGQEPEVLRSQFNTVLNQTIQSVLAARNFDGTNYLNSLTEGDLYSALVPLQIDGAYDNAVRAYNEALVLAPKNPSIYLSLARNEIAKEDNTKAKEYITKALEVKGNYTAAIFLLAQIQLNEGDVKEAIRSVEIASGIDPYNVGLFFQLGFMKYSDNDHAGAVRALERAIVLNPAYSNARYFLGLSYEQLGRVNDAIAQFEEVSRLNPENQEVKDILSNLRSGLDPFANVETPAPEDRDTPPVEETPVTE